MNFDFIKSILSSLFPSKQSTPEPTSEVVKYGVPIIPESESSNVQPSIANIVNDLPHHPTRKWNQRKLPDIKKIIVHHSDTTATDSGLNDIIQIAKYHTSPNNHISPQGCPAICYSLMIDKYGDIYQTNGFNSITWHCKGQNVNALGVCLIGGYNGQAVDVRQLTSLDTLLKHLIAIFGLTKQNIFGHRNFSSTECPGDEIYNWLQEWRNK